jgi:hypothetical protein
MYNETTQRIVEDAPKFGVDEVRIYDDRWLLGTEFYKVNRWIFELKSRNEHRGFGWYSWKPFVILQEMSRYARDVTADLVACDGHGYTSDDPPPIILWTDADTYPIADLPPLFEQCRKDGGIMLFAAEGCLQRHWCKRDMMIAMGQDEPRFLGAQHGTARFMLFEAGDWRAKQFLMEWLAYMLNPLNPTLEPSRLANDYPDFHEHRWDQAVMTNLVHKYGLKLYREADEFGDGTDRDRDIYPTVFKQVYRSPHNSLNGSRFRNV